MLERCPEDMFGSFFQSERHIQCPNVGEATDMRDCHPGVTRSFKSIFSNPEGALEITGVHFQASMNKLSRRTACRDLTEKARRRRRVPSGIHAMAANALNSGDNQVELAKRRNSPRA